MEQKLEHVRLLNVVTLWRSTASAVIPILIYERRELKVKKSTLFPGRFPLLGARLLKNRSVMCENSSRGDCAPGNMIGTILPTSFFLRLCYSSLHVAQNNACFSRFNRIHRQQGKFLSRNW